MANKDKNKGGGLGAAVRATAGRNLTPRETKQISTQTGASSAQILARAQKAGIGIGASTINKFNAGKLGTNFATQVEGPYGITYNPRADAKTSKALSELGALRNLRMQPGTSYMGYSQTGDQYNPIVLPKDALKSMGIGGKQTGMTGPYDNLTIPSATPGKGPGPWAGGYGMVGGDTTATTAPTEQPTAPMSVKQMQDESTGDSFFGFGGAQTWRSPSKRKGKGIASTSAASRSQRNSPFSNMLGV